MSTQRYLYPHIVKDLARKMVFVGGPRQCGKTTLAESLQKEFQQPLYLNWDDDEGRKRVLARSWSDTNDFVIFDEIHKFKRWKDWLKGVYDTQKNLHKFIVTGSARLDFYRRGGDSMLGRYHYWRLHPFSLFEVPAGITKTDAFARLLSVGGFPEPFLHNDPQEARRWRRERRERVIRDDLRDLEQVRNVQLISMLVDVLRARVGGTIVVANVAQELQVSPVTVGKWIEMLERMYLLFVVRPHTQKLTRALQKQFKVYFYDNADVDGDEGAIFENLVASHLLKKLHFLEDATGNSFELKFLRDREKHEVDFVILRNRIPIELIEAKWSDEDPSPHLHYFGDRLNVTRRTQVVGKAGKEWKRGEFRVISPIDYFDSIAAEL